MRGATPGPQRLPGAWAKIDQDEEGLPVRWRTLEDHSLDVAAVFRNLLEVPVLDARLARLGGLADLTLPQRDRLATLAGLHDVGKANHGFQNKGYRATVIAGHLGEILAILDNGDDPIARELIEGLALVTLADWCETGEEGLIEALYALWSHHGRPIQPPAVFPRKLWRRTEAYDPVATVRSCVASIRRAFPEAEEGERLPSTAPFVHAFLGLLTLADWIGSDERFFPLYPLDQEGAGEEEAHVDAAGVALRRIGLLPSDNEHRENLWVLDQAKFREIFGFRPNAIQLKALDEPLPGAEGSLRVLEAETGSGKTEMALAWFLRLYRAGLVDGLYFGLPTRAAAVQIHARVQRFAEASFGPEAPPVILAVPGYTKSEDADGTGIRSDGWRYAERGTEQDRSWAAEHPKRYLAGQLVVGTVDQILLSGLQVKHSHMRAAALLRHLLVVDEVHASDTYMARILEGVLQRHDAAGGHSLLLSATLGEAVRSRMLAPGQYAACASAETAMAQPYPALWAAERGNMPSALTSEGQDKVIEATLEPALTRPEEIARQALAAAAGGARVGILRNTVAEAVETQRALEAADPAAPLLECGGVHAPHHGRFGREDRIALDGALEKQLKREEPVIVVATQTIEQSLDIDFDLLVTDLCPVDVLVQRVGRLHRHERKRPAGFETAQVRVLVPDGPLEEYLRADGSARGSGGLGTVYYDLLALEGTRRLIAEHSTIRLPADSRQAIERVLHPERIRTLAESMGGKWMTHWSRVWGQNAAQENTANLNLVDWWLPLSRTRYTEPGEEVRTRLGVDSRRVLLPRGTKGIFASNLSEVAIPGWMAGGLCDEPEVYVEEAPDGGLIITADSCRYRYDRFGLQYYEEEASD